MNKLLLFFLIASTCLLAACGESAGQKLEQGNLSFDEGAYDDAFVAYASALEMAPDEAEPLYNIANTYYRQGIYTETHQLLPQVVGLSEPTLAAKGQHNLGNAYFQVEDWAAAVEAYKEALRTNPNDQEAKYNLELALRHLRQQQEAEQQQNEQNQDNEQEQEEQEEQNQDSQEESQQDQESQSNSEQEENEQEQENEGEENQSEEQEQSSSPQSDEESSEESTEQEQQSSQPQQVEGLTEEQARRLLGTVGQNTETLQERLQQIYVAPGPPPEKDW